MLRTLTAVLRVDAPAEYDPMQSLSDAACWIDTQLTHAEITTTARVFEGDETADRHAMLEGWLVVNYESTGLYQIQRHDSAGQFANDGEALRHVRKLAKAGSSLHKEALALHTRDAKAIEAFRKT